ncbi:7360_t:CDS:2 [Acaulospora morrowiae]|uniref:7360_t:CDS:1 n=1 Tax=Acaulospora morrowiae TaxID=94023 RepID=A0A9N9EV00_9GLOM|nr:7360_t:CDS:2 [Acaulospora morrowiae]
MPISGTPDVNALSTLLNAAVTTSVPIHAPPVSVAPVPVTTPSIQSHNSLVSDPNTLVKNLMEFGLLGNNNIISNLAGTIGNANMGGFNFGGNTPTPPQSGSVAGDIPTTILHVNDIEKILLTSNDIQRKRDGAIAILYDAFPLQCKQCGFRYARNDDGKAKMDSHLDWHFRQNRRMKEKAKKTQSRSWFVSEEVVHTFQLLS